MVHYLLHDIASLPSRYSLSPDRFESVVAGVGNHTLTFDDGYASIFEPIISLTRKQASRVTVFLVAGKVGSNNNWDSGGPLAGQRLLDWDNIRELQNRGVVFGSHSMTHANLQKLLDADLKAELEQSKKILEDRLGSAISGLAYPYGLFDRRVIAAVRETGYGWAATASDSLLQGRGDPFRTRRIEIKGDDSAWLVRLKMKGGYDLKCLAEFPVLLFEKLSRSRTSDYHQNC